jgi:polyhydroxyalkanoate synthesis repressor PhaR
MTLIKRYANRKLYDSESRRYVTLSEVSGMIRQGAEVQVIDHATNEDITSLILTQIILEAGKKDGELLPLSFLVNLIQKSKERLSRWEDGILHLESEILKENIPTRPEAPPFQVKETDLHGERVLVPLSQSVNGIIQECISGLITSQQLTQEEGSRLSQLIKVETASSPHQVELMEEMIQTILASLQLPTSQDIRELSEQIELLRQRLSQAQG